jgi:septum formation protein
MKQLGWEFRQISPDIDEKAIRTDDPYELPLIIALAKADAIVNKLREENSNQETLIITAGVIVFLLFSNSNAYLQLLHVDQIVLFQNEVREKPENEAMAIQYLSSYSNHHVSTLSAVVCTYYPSLLQAKGVDIATVHWGPINDEVVAKVIAKGEIYSSAGGFRIEDEDLVNHIMSIEGTVDSVFGLPVDLTIELINDVTRPPIVDILENDDAV